jgi:hypothetical protein
MANTNNNMISSTILISGLNIEVLICNQRVSEDHQSGRLCMTNTNPTIRNNMIVSMNIISV